FVQRTTSKIRVSVSSSSRVAAEVRKIPAKRAQPGLDAASSGAASCGSAAVGGDSSSLNRPTSFLISSDPPLPTLGRGREWPRSPAAASPTLVAALGVLLIGSHPRRHQESVVVTPCRGSRITAASG